MFADEAKAAYINFYNELEDEIEKVWNTIRKTNVPHR